MASSSRRSYDTDTITLRTVFAKNGANSNIPALRVLTADGTGGCYWAIPSTLGMLPAFNQIITSAGNYTADLSFNTFRLLEGEGIGMVNGAPGSNTTTLYAKAFNTIDVSGDNGIAAFSNGNLNATVNLAGGGSVQVRSDPATNTIFIEGPTNAFVSTGIYGFHQFKFIDGASTILSNTYTSPGTFITANSPSTVLNFIGVGDLLISTQTTYNTAFLSISTFTSKGYLAISGEAFSAYPSSLSTVSSLYAQTGQLLSVSQYFSSAIDWSYSSFISTINFLAMSTGSNFFITTGLINANAAVDASNYYENKSTIQGLGNIFTSTPTLDTLFVSTVQGLGSAGYISTLDLVSTVAGLGTVSIEPFLVSTVDGLGSSGYISTLDLVSTVDGLGSAGYISTLDLVSTVASLQKYNIVSSLYASRIYDITGLQDTYVIGSDMFFSSFAFSLSSFSSYITDESQVFIQQNPNFVFSEFSTPTLPFVNFDVKMDSALGVENDTTLLGTAIGSYIGVSFTPGQCNYWTGPLMFPLPTNYITSYIQSNFIIQHALFNGYASPISLNEGFALSTLTIRGDAFNTVFLHIYNS